ncbi:MAG: GH3 auxin-responsive promoter family protein [Bacteroidaceae bacterium]|nr:GH3 auxin-responsive promoter family protein [Bacteroidaceae bacterium]
MNKTDLIRKFFIPRQRALEKLDKHSIELQNHVIQYLIKRGADTEWGKKYNFDKINNYEDFSRQVPVTNYEDLKGYIDRMRHGEKNILWPGQVKWYAKSSGTTNDKSKFIPVSKDGLQSIHYLGGKDCICYHLNLHKKSRIFDGKNLILGGSHQPNYNVANSLVGDLSAILLENLSPMINAVRTPSKKTALLADFEKKRDRIAHESIKHNVVTLSGVPSWMMSVLKRVLEVSGKNDIHEVWPELEVFWHGGVAFTPYREQYKQLIPSDIMNYMETYNASEGFFGIQNDPNDPSLMLMTDYGMFYEFIPVSEVDSENPTVVPLEGVEVGKNYAMVISNVCGLWRYLIGDTVRFTSKEPYKFVITGRTKHFINAFGEELIVDNAEKGLAKACAETNALIKDYTAAPIFMDQNAHCRHQWLIEFEQEPSSLEEFVNILDTELQHINSDYEAKRYKDITLQKLEVIVARKGLFDEWLKEKGKLGGQHKIPRLSNNRDYIDEMISMNK